MKPLFSVTSLCAISILSAALAAGPARADRALVVGINHYPRYADMDLGGPLNDARAMQGALQKQGFQVTTLTDRQATHSGVTKALQTLRAQMQPHERFVFYFSGHGARDARERIALLAHDAVVDERDGNENEKTARSGSIPIAQLHQLVCAIPARGRTIILDAPFPLFSSIAPPRATSPAPKSTLTPISQRTTQGGFKACYFVAGQVRENPGEDVFAGVPYGVFTYFLTKHLNAMPRATSQSKTNQSWNTLFTRVSSDVAKYMGNRQHPRLSSPYLQSAIFEGRTPQTRTQLVRANMVGKAPVETPLAEPPIVGMPQPIESMRPSDFIKSRGIKIERKPEVTTKPGGTWGEWSDFNTHRDQLNMKMRPDRIDIAVGQEVAFEVSVAAPGYLVVLERGTSGKVNLVFPSNAKIEEAQVEATAADNPLKLPEGDFAFAPDAPGLERVRAYWFADKGAAEALLGHFGDERSVADASNLRRPENYPLTGDGVRTADVLFEVVSPPNP